MESTIELIVELIVGVVLLFAASWAFVHFTGYGDYYDKMLSENSYQNKILNENKKENKDNDEDENSSSVN